MAGESRCGDFFAGLIIGGFIGAAIALLLAPQRGEETLAQLREKGIELKEARMPRARRGGGWWLVPRFAFHGQKKRLLPLGGLTAICSPVFVSRSTTTSHSNAQGSAPSPQ